MTPEQHAAVVRKAFALTCTAQEQAEAFTSLKALVAQAQEADRLREALAAYRSAMRSGEPETEKLGQVGDAALAGPQDEEPDWSKCDCGAGPQGVHARRCRILDREHVCDQEETT